MAKSLNDILKRYEDVISGKLPPSKIETLTTGDVPGVDYADKMKDGRDFVGMHTVQKHPDRNGNGDDVFKGSTKKAKMERHGHEPKPKDVQVYNKTQQVSEARVVPPVPGSHHKVDQDGSIGHHVVTSLSDGVVHTQNVKTKEKFSYPLKHWPSASSPIREEVEITEKKIVKKVKGLWKKVSDAHDKKMKENDDFRRKELGPELYKKLHKEAKLCETCGKTPCGCDTNDKSKKPKKLLLEPQVNEMATSQNQAIAARIALKHKREGTMPPKGTASHSMMGMSEKQLKDYTKAEKGAPKKVEEEIHHSGRTTASEKAREKRANTLERMKIELMKHKLKMREQNAVDTPITFPASNSREGFDRI